MNKELRKVVRAAEAQGWRVEATKKGWMLYPPQTSQGAVAVHGTPSDVRALHNTIAEMRRRGFIWPPP
jgi:hypothetical protein